MAGTLVKADLIQGVQGTRRDMISTKAAPLMARSPARAGVPDTRKENQKPLDKSSKPSVNTAPSDRAAELRAKLLAIRSASGSTPTPEIKPKNEIQPKKLNTISIGSDGKSKAETKADLKPGTEEVGTTNEVDISEEKKLSERFSRRDSEADIEGLFAEARAAVEAEKTTGQEQKKELNGSETPKILSAKKDPKSKPQSMRRPSLNDSVNSLETSEQGEIREDLNNAGEGRPPREFIKAKVADIPPKSTNLGKAREPAAINGKATTRKKYVDTELANGHGDDQSPVSAPARQGSASSRTASVDHPLLPKPALHRAKEDRSTQAERFYRPEREIHVTSQDDERERERKAAEYKRELESRRQRPTATRAVAEREVEEPRRSRQIVPSNTKIPEIRPNGKEAEVAQEPIIDDDGKDLEDWLQMTGYHDRAYRKKALDRHRKLIALEVQKAELQREAQLEYEERTQIARAQSVLPRESVERDMSRAVISPNDTRTVSVSTMPPPPVPIKQDRETVGLKIRDSAASEPSSSRGRFEDEHRSAKAEILSPVETSSLKRHHILEDHEYEESRPADKIARTNVNGRAVPRGETESTRNLLRSSSVSLERRIASDDGKWGRNGFKEDTDGRFEVDRQVRPYRGGPQSPYREPDRQRFRSLSPIPRRISEQDGYVSDRRTSNDFNTDRVGQLSRGAVLSRDSSPPHRIHNGRLTHQSHPYDDYREEPPAHKPSEGKFKRETTSRASSEYQDYLPSRTYEHHPYITNSGRAHGRGRGGYYHTRGGYRSLKGGEEHGHNGSQSLDLKAGGQYMS